MVLSKNCRIQVDRQNIGSFAVLVIGLKFYFLFLTVAVPMLIA